MEEKKMGLIKGAIYTIVVAGATYLGANYINNAKANAQPARVKVIDGECQYVDNVAGKQYGCEIVNNGMSVLSDPTFGKAVKVLGDIANKLNGKINTKADEKSQLEKSVQDNLEAIKGLKQ